MTHVVKRVQVAKLDVPLRSPFAIATTKLEGVRNVAVRVELECGTCGLGEAACLVPVTAWTQDETLRRLKKATPTLVGTAFDACDWNDAIRTASKACLVGWEAASARAAWECAVVDAMTRARKEPMWNPFQSNKASDGREKDPQALQTCITVPIETVERGMELANAYQGERYAALKIKVGRGSCDGKELDHAEAEAEGKRAGRIAAAAPTMKVVVDANEAFGKNLQAAKAFLHAYQSQADKLPWILEQPMLRTERESSKQLKEWVTKEGIWIAVDEGCRTLEDAKRVVQSKEADIVNVKMAKSGLIGALDIVDLVLASGMQLMLGGMVETRIGMGCAAHLAAGLGCFEVVDLDTPLLLSQDPVLRGPRLEHGAYWLESSGCGTDCDIMLDWQG
mmetsp:Transcript_8421/g.29951  ORF Transcript_8421/g.29951 Transcript_8421/m.29951 type:complete len:393 (+) Transcript_8421:1429-2607(+)